MFSSRRKSRPQGQMLPPSDPGNASKNALAAATAIGQALKTGTPIPRSNSLQRTSSLQRNSFTSATHRSSSLMGHQGPPRQFQQTPQSSPHRSAPPPRSQSFTVSSQQNKAAIQRASSASLNKGPRMVKKHIPGPYGLITIEVPAEEPVARAPSVKKAAAPKRAQSLTRPKPSFSDSTGSTRSRSSSNASSKRPMFVDDLPEVNEDEPLTFEQSQPQHVLSTPAKNHLTFIEEEKEDESTPIKNESQEEIAEKVEGVDELEKLKLEKESAESKISDEFEEDMKKEQQSLTEKNEIFKKPEIFVEEEKQASDHENDVLEQYTDLPSTAKSSNTLGAAQSSITTADSDTLNEKELGGSMAQQLRPTIPAYYNKESAGNSPLSLNDANSSIYSDEQQSGRSGDELEVPSRSEKRNQVSPRKSALKIKSDSSGHLPLSATTSNNNAASQAYLSLATAENTRLNAMSTSNHSSTSLARSTSSRIAIDKPINGRAGQMNGSSRTQPPSQVPERSTLRPPQRPMSAMDSPSRQGPGIQRPQSAQGMRPLSVQGMRQQQPPQFRPQSAQGFRQQQQPQQRKHQQSQIPRSASNAAALNATLKKNEPPRPALEKKSSFEKERPHDSHAAFKRKSLRDPTFGGHQNMESNLGFYRHQAQRAQQQQPAQQVTPQQNFNQTLGGISGNFRSRFNESDSDSEEPMTKFAPPPSNPALRKPKSTFTLRASSVSGIPKNQSPAKSLPEKRATRYFSESDKEQLFNEHLEKAKAAVHEEKKSRFGKLKKLFGRSKD